MERARSEYRGFYAEGTWANALTITLALALVLAARGLWSLRMGPLLQVAGILLWWAGVCVFLRWVALHSLSARDYRSWAARLLATLGAAWVFLWTLEQSGLELAWTVWLANSIIVLMALIAVWYFWRQEHAGAGAGGSQDAA